jgi:hypothetical protein
MGSLSVEEDTHERQRHHPEHMFTVVVENQDDDVDEMQTRWHTALSADRTSYALENVRAQRLDLQAEKPPTDRSLLAEMLVSKIARSELLLSGHALGEGSTGIVYRGIVCETEVAVKVMHTNMNEDARKHALADLHQVFLPTPHQPAHQTLSSIPSDLALKNHCSYPLYCS